MKFESESLDMNRWQRDAQFVDVMVMGQKMLVRCLDAKAMIGRDATKGTIVVIWNKNRGVIRVDAWRGGIRDHEIQLSQVLLGFGR